MQKLELGADYNPDDAVTPSAANGETTVTSTTPTNSSTNAPTSTTTRTQTMPKMNPRLPLVIGAVAIVAGLLTGIGAYRMQNQANVITGPDGQPIEQIAEEGNIKNGDIFGSQDGSAFKDSAEGYLQIGSMEGEGSHQLLRAGGASQTVYLVSTVTDLDKFDGMNIKVWGETYKGQNVGWLMDVGRVEIVNTVGENPSAQ